MGWRARQERRSHGGIIPSANVDDPNKALVEQVNRSGFPFQLAVDHAVRTSQQTHGWSVVATELPWEASGSASDRRKGFVDLVLRKGGLNLVVECKRLSKQTWAFLLPSANQATSRVRANWWNSRAPERSIADGYLDTSKVFCDDFSIVPASPESEYCVLPKDRGALTSLEELTQEMVLAAHSIAGEPGVGRSSGIDVYIPTIVTTARLSTCAFNPGAVDLDAGTLPSGDWLEHDLIRFRKTLTLDRSNDYDEGIVTLADWQHDRTRTVLVVRAAALLSMLTQLNTDGWVPDAYRHPPRQ